MVSAMPSLWPLIVRVCSVGHSPNEAAAAAAAEDGWVRRRSNRTSLFSSMDFWKSCTIRATSSSMSPLPVMSKLLMAAAWSAGGRKRNKEKETKPNQSKPNQTKPNQTKPLPL